jgi:protein SCO1/2
VTRAWGLLAATVVLGVVASCGGDDRALVGYTRDPEPVVDVATLPDVSRDGEPFAMRAPDDGLLLVFFGFTNCPDVCPGTLLNVSTALRELGDDASRVALAMVTVDPERDIPLLTDYVQAFVPDAHALATADPDALRTGADAFGVTYHVSAPADGEPHVMHSPQLFLVDDAGTLVLTWPFGTPPEDLAADVRQLLDA